MAARALGYIGEDYEMIALMDDFKESGQIAIGDEFGVEKVITGRQYLQNFGNEAREVFGDNFWIDQVLPHPSDAYDREGRFIENTGALAARYPDADIVVLSDLRYPNEAERVKALGGTVWEVQRPGLESDGHASEQPLPAHLIDIILNNTSDLEHLQDEVRAALEVTVWC